MANPIYPIAAAAGASLDFLTNYVDEGRKAQAKREKDWLDFNERKKQPGFNVDTDPYVIAGRARHAQNPKMDQMQQAANQAHQPSPSSVGANGMWIPGTPQHQAQVARLTSNPELKAQFKNKFPYKYNELFNPTNPRSNNSTASNNTTTNAAEGAINNSQPSNQGSMVASKKNNPTDLGHLPNKPNGDMFWGSSPYVSTASLLNPVQQQSQSNLLPEVTNRLRNPVNFNDISNETKRQFHQEILPGIKHGFTGRTNGKLSSPDFTAAVQQGSEGLQTKLAAQRADFEERQRTQDQNLFGTLMGRSQESFYNPGEKGLAKEFASKALGKVSEFALDQGLDYIKNLWSSNPAEAASEGAKVIQSLSPDRKKQLFEYVTTGAGKSAPQNVKDLVAQHASPSAAGSSTAANIAMTAAGVAAAGTLAYYGSKWIRPLFLDQGE